MDLHKIDWAALERLRKGFLNGTGGQGDYWHSRSDLESYDQTFGRRIGWKWDYVLGELERLGWSPPTGAALDFGCGTGQAGRRFFSRFGQAGVTGIVLADRSPLAVDFAAEKLAAQFPGLPVERYQPGRTPPAVLLVSHVLGELDESQLAELLAIARQAQTIVWVEPGDYDDSRRLIAVREQLRGDFRIVAPCTHQNVCPMLDETNQRHWCHFFADSPPGTLANPDWVHFARLAGIDLRSLPVSYLVLDKRAAVDSSSEAVRVIGRPRVYKAYALLTGCDHTGLHERRFLRRRSNELYRRLKKGDLPSRQFWQLDGEDIAAINL